MVNYTEIIYHIISVVKAVNDGDEAKHNSLHGAMAAAVLGSISKTSI